MGKPAMTAEMLAIKKLKKVHNFSDADIQYHCEHFGCTAAELLDQEENYLTILVEQNAERVAELAKDAKDPNPKDAIGARKWRQFTIIPMTVMWEIGAGMFEGAWKYGRHNYRVSDVRASIYVDAAMGHITSWWEGQDIDPDSGINELSKAICSLVVLRDAQIQSKMIDDRPPGVDLAAHKKEMQRVIDNIFSREDECRAPYTRNDHG